MNAQQKFDRFVGRYPHDHSLFWKRPEWTRRHWFRMLGAGLSGCFFSPPFGSGQLQAQVSAGVSTQNKARNCIFILLAGAPSHIDTFDFKEVIGVTPTNLQPETINGIRFPVGLLPKIAEQLPHIAIVRSARAWAAVHGLAQTWTQIGRNPTSALGKIAPHIGSVVAIEKQPERTPGMTFPPFLALNVGNSPGAGYFPATFAPFKIAPATGGLANTAHPAGQARFGERWNLLHQLDDGLRKPSPLGASVMDMDAFYSDARNLMYNPIVDQAFRYSSADSLRYGNNGFGNACLVAKQVLAANQGTRFVQINLGGWDMHSNIYDPNAVNGLYQLGRRFDTGLGSLIADLESSGMLKETLVVASGEFGRTVGRLSAANGRDHFLQQFVLFAGASISGGRAIGATDPAGAFTVDAGWSRGRDARNEDIEATIYSALGINWTTIRYDDPFGRGFEYVPYSKDDIYGPINELWA